MPRNTLRIVALAAAAIIAIAGSGGFAAADGDHSRGNVLQHLRDHVATAQAAVAAAQAPITAILAAQTVMEAQTQLTSSISALAVTERALTICTRDNNCSGTEATAITIARTVVSNWRSTLATARDTAAAAIDADSAGDETWAAFVATRTRAQTALTSAQRELYRYLNDLRFGRVSDVPSGRCRVAIEALPQNRRFHVWGSGTVCWDHNGDGDFDDDGELGSLLLID